MKPVKQGSNAFTLCDARNCYCLNFILFTGTEFTEQIKIKSDINFNRVNVIDLCSNYFNTNHSIFIDNYINSINLVNYMLINKTYITGTCNFTKIDKDNMNEVITKDEKNTKYLYF